MTVPKGKLIIIGGAVDMNTNLSAQEDILKPDHLKFFEQGLLNRINCRGNYHRIANPRPGWR
jgi:cyanophycinase